MRRLEPGARRPLTTCARSRTDPASSARSAPTSCTRTRPRRASSGALAARRWRARRPVIVHTYHGHVLEGYFGRGAAALYRLARAALARASATPDRRQPSDRRRARAARRRAARERSASCRLGLDLDHLLARAPMTARRSGGELGVRQARRCWSASAGWCRSSASTSLLRAVARARALGARVRLAVVGDGSCAAELERAGRARSGSATRSPSPASRADIAAIVAAADLALLTSDNEGTPVALIEAAAGARPAVATASAACRRSSPRRRAGSWPRGDVARSARRSPSSPAIARPARR